MVPYHSKEDLRKRGYTVNGTVFADLLTSLERMTVTTPISFVQASFSLHLPYVCLLSQLTLPELDATIELVYWPDLGFDVRNHFNVLHLIRLVSSPLPETQYRHKQGLVIHTFCMFPVLMNFLVSGCMFGWVSGGKGSSGAS